MVLALMSVHKVFGVIITIGHFLMFMSSTQMLPLPKNAVTISISLHERQMQRSYDQRVREVEHGSFTPLVFFPHQEEWENVLL